MKWTYHMKTSGTYTVTNGKREKL